MSKEATVVPVEVANEKQPAVAERILPQERCEQLKRTWLETQSSFIDEPREAVRKADGMVQELLSVISGRFEETRQGLEAEWNRGQEASTEALRVALQRYRALFDRLLAL